MVKCSNSKSTNQLDPHLDLLVLLLNFLATVDEHHFQLLNIATKNNKKSDIVFQPSFKYSCPGKIDTGKIDTFFEISRNS